MRKVYYEYLVKWKNCPIKDASWLTEVDIHKHGNEVEEIMDMRP
jgi:hypothetical protein